MKFVILSLIIHTSYGSTETIPVTSERFETEIACHIRAKEVVSLANDRSMMIQMEEGFETSVDFTYRCD